MNANKDLNALSDNKAYNDWIVELKQRYLSARLRASQAVTTELLRFYWSVGQDIASKQWANTYGSAFYKTLSRDLQREMPDVRGLSETNLKYMYYFYCLYSRCLENRPQPADDSKMSIRLQGVDDFTKEGLFSIPWFHHQRIIDHCKDNTEKALYYVHETLRNNWGRNTLLNFLKSDLYEREGKAVSNFRNTLPCPQGDLAQQITRDPYNFDFLTLTKGFKEKELEDALVANVTRFLLELGAGWAYMGRQIRFGVGEKEVFPDLLFYNTHIHAYCVIELKVGSFKAEYLGQLSLYVATINHQMRSEHDNPTIGLLICRDKDNVMAQYSLENISAPIGISEYQLSKLYPTDLKSSLPSIEEIEKQIQQTVSTKSNQKEADNDDE